jgi:crotonobetainyl-CoA:carnitine CoA-transferase CaiB-like acyl-CoA transferase
MSKIMSGIRVVELADYVFVPAAASVLSDWGADVIKVEHHERGDLMRGLRTFHPGAVRGPNSFNALMEGANRGKRSIGLNLANPEGRQVFVDIIKTADVFLTSKLTSTRQKLAIDVDDLRAHNPSLIYVRGTGHGIRGPEADKGGFDQLDFWYRSGMALGAKAYEAEHIPIMPAGAFGDLISAMNVAGGVCGALFHRERTGEAVTVDVSLLASAMWSMGGGVTQAELYNAPNAQRPVGELPNPLIGTYATSDGRWIALCCLQAVRHWRELCQVAEIPGLGDDARFATVEGIEQHSPMLVQVLRAVFAGRTYAEWEAVLAHFSGQWSPVQNTLEVIDDPQVRANGYVLESKSTTGQPIVVVQPPVQFDETHVSTKPAPAFNDSGDELLAELGMSMDEILSLKIAGAVV